MDYYYGKKDLFKLDSYANGESSNINKNEKIFHGITWHFFLLFFIKECVQIVIFKNKRKIMSFLYLSSNLYYNALVKAKLDLYSEYSNLNFSKILKKNMKIFQKK